MELKKYKIKLILLIAIVAIIYTIPLNYIEGRSFCILYNLFDIECLGCGFTRAFFNVTRLNIIEAINYNKMIILLGPLAIGIYVLELTHTLKILKNREKYSDSIVSKLYRYLIKG